MLSALLYFISGGSSRLSTYSRAQLLGARPDWSRAANRPTLVSTGKGVPSVTS
jgi:hypothetical protein